MTLLDLATSYTTAQKGVAWGFIVCGVGLITAFLVLSVQSTLLGPLWQGVKIGALVSGLMILIGGIAYLRYCDSTFLQISSAYQDGPQAALLEEMERMSKVVSDFPVHQLRFALVVVVALGVVLLAPRFWAGVAFPFAFLYLSVLLIEAHSHTSILEYSVYLEEETKRP